VTNTDFIITVSGLTKIFDGIVAVDDNSFSVQPGTTTGLLGGNGAGKTTTIAMLLGLLTPTRGQIRILGEDMVRNRYRVLGRLNFSSPYVDLPKRLSVRENLNVYARLYGVRDRRARIAALTEDFALGPFLAKPYGDLSSGQKTRVLLAKALLNEPAVLLLDEPTASLDPDTADWVRGRLETYQAQTGATFFMASHNMAEVERLCDDVLMMRAGVLVDQGSPAQLIERHGRRDMEEVFLAVARGETSLTQQTGDQQTETPS
jgi:ABC-2 type transport system ATP-binding protein